VSVGDYALGDWITVVGGITRVGDETNFKRWWEPYTFGPSKALVVGRRTLADGYVDRSTESDGWTSYTVKTWIPELHFTAYLVVTDLRCKPFYVLPGQIKEPDDE
jgi:hypothetical protein